MEEVGELAPLLGWFCSDIVLLSMRTFTLGYGWIVPVWVWFLKPLHLASFFKAHSWQLWTELQGPVLLIPGTSEPVWNQTGCHGTVCHRVLETACPNRSYFKHNFFNQTEDFVSKGKIVHFQTCTYFSLLKPMEKYFLEKHPLNLEVKMLNIPISRFH